jgi:predicted XRE-type DNA-binding protein
MLTYIHLNIKESITIRITQKTTKNNLNQEEITTNQETQSHESTSYTQSRTNKK